ncbi:FAD dependent oxidoreductase [Microdochium bolleyi]|uniref:FAD dependent oxidoreductase n=1 Tax=Microdochium bolleyi TaxID=196109 RepID=A0A136J624_9PEZI|nr:FAD dependent oxidoreductase [Microdochium bolleyi]
MATSSSSSQPAPAQRKNITIIGGGIIGCTTAYYLTRHPLYDRALHRITLLEASSSSSAGGRIKDSIQDAATLAYPDSAQQQQQQQQRQQEFNPAHDGIAGGASGKAGGLLARWAFPDNIVPLSFRLHEELAREHGGQRRWGYRRCWASQVECRARLPGPLADSSAGGAGRTAEGRSENADGNTKGLHKDHKKSAAALKRLGVPEDLDWLDTATGDGGLEAYENMGTPDNTAQVHPELFTRSMAALAEERGVRIVTGARVTSINSSPPATASPGVDAHGNTTGQGSVQSVTYISHSKSGNGTSSSAEQGEEQVTLPSTDVIVAAGPWTSRVLPAGPPVSASRAHSVVIKPARPVSAYALFTAITLPPGFPEPATGDTTSKKSRTALKRPTTVEPEIYARPDGTAYACGPTDTDVALPLLSSDVAVDEARCDDIVAQVAAISDELDPTGRGSRPMPEAAQVLAKQACYLPQGGPWIGRVPGQPRGVVVAAGHTCWGIQNAPATGLLVSEVVMEGEARSARLGGCDPARAM